MTIHPIRTPRAALAYRFDYMGVDDTRGRKDPARSPGLTAGSSAHARSPALAVASLVVMVVEALGHRRHSFHLRATAWACH